MGHFTLRGFGRLDAKPRRGAGVVIAIVIGLFGGLGTQARADTPKEEHVTAGMGMGKAGGGWASMNRPANDTETRAMKEVVCPCGSCTRLSIIDCDCQTAAQLRGKVQSLLATADLSNDNARRRAYDSVLAAFTAEYGAKVLATPTNDASWLLPALAVVGALGLLLLAGRRWVGRGNKFPPVTMSAAPTALDDEYAEKLDDELAETD